MTATGMSVPVLRTGALLLALSACHHRGAPAPTIETLTPAAADVSRGEQVTVTVVGRDFDALNTVRFGPIALRQVPRASHSRTASTLRFTVPVNDEQQPDRGGAPVRPLASGRYSVQVITARGTSNAVFFTLTNGSVDRD
jgi:hypothetical protein